MPWDIDPILFDLPGPLEIRWYGLFFVAGLLLGIRKLEANFRVRGYPEEHAGALSLLLPLGMILGAHFVHLVFYEPESLTDISRILAIGSGLASHGGAFGSILALYLFCRAKKVSFLSYADAIVVGASWTMPFVRIGNFFNSEIYGRLTDVAWAVEFRRVAPGELRHPSQLYEAAYGFAIVALAYALHRRWQRFKPGQIFSAVLAVYFTSRFFTEYVKEYQRFTADVPLTMGQMLSLPLVVIFVVLFFWSGRASAPYSEPAPMLDDAGTEKAPANGGATVKGASGAKPAGAVRRKGKKSGKRR